MDDVAIAIASRSNWKNDLTTQSQDEDRDAKASFWLHLRMQPAVHAATVRVLHTLAAEE